MLSAGISDYPVRAPGLSFEEKKTASPFLNEAAQQPDITLKVSEESARPSSLESDRPSQAEIIGKGEGHVAELSFEPKDELGPPRLPFDIAELIDGDGRLELHATEGWRKAQRWSGVMAFVMFLGMQMLAAYMFYYSSCFFSSAPFWLASSFCVYGVILSLFGLFVFMPLALRHRRLARDGAIVVLEKEGITFPHTFGQIYRLGKTIKVGWAEILSLEGLRLHVTEAAVTRHFGSVNSKSKNPFVWMRGRPGNSFIMPELALDQDTLRQYIAGYKGLYAEAPALLVSPAVNHKALVKTVVISLSIWLISMGALFAVFASGKPFESIEQFELNREYFPSTEIARYRRFGFIRASVDDIVGKPANGPGLTNANRLAAYNSYRSMLASDYPHAIDELQKIIMSDAADADALYCCGNVYIKQGKYTEALPYFKRALAINPRDGESYESLAYAHLQLKQYDQAIQASKQALACDAFIFGAYNIEAQANFELGRHPEALDLVNASMAHFGKIDANKQSLDNDQVAWMHTIAGRALLSRGDYQQAIDAFTRALSYANLQSAKHPQTLNVYRCCRISDKQEIQLERAKAYDKLGFSELARKDRQ